MRYFLSVELNYLPAGEAFPEPAKEALITATMVELRTKEPDLEVLDLVILVRADNIVTIRATLQGASPARLTSPLEAMTKLDASLDRALLLTGMFEEFDVARKVLRVSPSELSE